MSQDDFDSLKEAGNRFFRNKQYHEAKRCYTKAISARGDVAVLYSNRAMCNLNIKSYYEALDDCDTALKLDTNLTKAYYRRGMALMELARFRLAVQDFERVFKDEPDNMFAKSELDKAKSILESDTRIDLQIYEKPKAFRSKRPLDEFNYRPGNFSGAHTYSE